MLVRALTHVHRGPGSWKTVLGGSVLTLLSFLLVPLVLLSGYTARVAEGIVDEPHSRDDGAPTFEPWGTLAYEGGKVVALVVLYFVPSILVLGVTGAVSTTRAGGFLTVSAPSGLALAGFAAAALLALPSWYVGAAGFVNFVRMGRFTDAFKFSKFSHVLTSWEYARRWLLALALVAASGLFELALVVASAPLDGVFALLPFAVGSVPAAVVLFYVIVASSFLYAHGFEEARTVERASEESSDQATA